MNVTGRNNDVFSTVGLFGFILVPVTYIATRIWEVRHPGPVVGTNEGSLDGDMGLVLAIGALSMTVVVVGHILHSMRLAQLERASPPSNGIMMSEG